MRVAKGNSKYGKKKNVFAVYLSLLFYDHLISILQPCSKQNNPLLTPISALLLVDG